MRPAQLEVLGSEPAPPVGPARMVPATVVTGSGGAGAGLSLSASFNGNGAIGSTDGGTGPSTPWVGTGTGTWVRRDNRATYLGVGADNGGILSVGTGQPLASAVHRVTLRLVGEPAGNCQFGLNQTAVTAQGSNYNSAGMIYLFPNADANTHIPHDGDVIQVTDTLDANDVSTLVYTLNGVVVSTWVLRAGLHFMAAGRCGFSGNSLPNQSDPDWGFSNWSFTPSGAGGTDVAVDFGDGVAVPLPRLASIGPLATGDIVLVHRQGHSAVLIDKIVPLGGA